GHWGLTLALIAARSGSDVMLYARRPEVAAFMLAHRHHPQFLTEMALPPSVAITDRLMDAANFSDAWILVVPSQHMREMAGQLAAFVRPGLRVLSGSKGLEQTTYQRMTSVLQEVWKNHHASSVELGAISGPNLAHDISQGLPAATVVATAHKETFHQWGKILGRSNLRVYFQQDVIGVELGGALKNVLAIAVGAAAAAQLGDSAQAAIMTRGLHEMGQLSVKMGAQWDTLAGLAGIGDVVATAMAQTSRNRWCGEQLAQGRSLPEILSSTAMVIEGVPTAAAAAALGKKFSLPMPITTEVLAMFAGRSVMEAVQRLMARDLVAEFH
ncbi:MAG: NAD(P)-dependent glycerol-3-phosphate dehydrogenase, partial [Firmicutes bacterium]|nr:NAD(P)-dependent glycerol-3-phosphate dehydrogenase [Bacillota bacterium]